MISGYVTYEIVLLGAMFVAILATPAATYLAKRLGLVDAPGLRKVHVCAIPRIGGSAILFAMLALTVPVLCLDNLIGLNFRQNSSQLLAIFIGGLMMFAIGLIDDIRGLKARVKLMGQVSAALLICMSGLRIENITLPGVFTIELGLLAWPLTVLWIVGLTNSLNLIDGMDGLAGGISAIVAVTLAIFALNNGLRVQGTLMLALGGALIGFLFLNFNPARIFMGDCGSLMIGFLIATISISSSVKTESSVALAITLLAMGVPVFDTLFSMLRRTMQRRGIFSPDRGHIHHRLLAMGLKQHQVALLIYAVTIIASALGLSMMFLGNKEVLFVFLISLVMLVLVFRMAGAVRLKETVIAWRRNTSIANQFRKQQQDFDTVQLLLCEARTFDQWWAALCRAAKDLQFVRLSLNLVNRDGTSRTLLWHANEDVPVSERVTLAVPVQQRRSGGPLRAEVDIFIGGSVESAGRRMSLFGRLVDEHSLAKLPLIQKSEFAST